MTNNALGEEVWWLRGFGWSATRIAQRLDCPVAAVQKHLARQEPDYQAAPEDVLEVQREARREARVVYSRTVHQWRS